MASGGTLAEEERHTLLQPSRATAHSGGCCKAQPRGVTEREEAIATYGDVVAARKVDPGRVDAERPRLFQRRDLALIVERKWRHKGLCVRA